MKKKLLYIVALVLVSASACKKDYLETNPTSQIDGELALGTTENLKAGLNGIYRYMFERTTATTSNTQAKPGVTGILLGTDFSCEDIGISASNWFTATGEGNWNGFKIDNGAVTLYYYRTFYRMITNANMIIDHVDAATGTDADKAKIKAEALTIRAYAYSYLVQFYGKRYDASAKPNNQLGVPLVLKSTDEKMPRATVEEVYASINTDLDQAITLFAAGSTDMTKKHVNIWVARGLKARVALTMQDYPTAITYAKQVIDGGVYRLMDREKYMSGFNDAVNLSEFMWASIPTVDQNDAFGSYFAQIAYNANSSFMRANPKRINSALYNTISATDIRKSLWEPAPTAANFPLPTASFSRQEYMSRKFSTKGGVTSLGDFPFMRSSEMYLILAEAYASGGQSGLAQDVLLSYITARDTAPVRSTNTGAALVEEILNNRRVELWAEGFRWFDLKRLNRPMDRTVVPNYIPGTVGNFVKVDAGDPSWQYKIPLLEIQANPSIGQANQNP